MTRLAYVPAVGTPEELTDLLSRAAWFLALSSIEEGSILIEDPALETLEWRVAWGTDPAIEERFESLRRRVRFVSVRRARAVKRALKRADALLGWRRGAVPNSAAYLTRKQIFAVDPHADRMEGANYLSARLRLWAQPADHTERFRGLARRLGRFDRAFVLATGPSAAEYRHFDYSESLGIVCNTAILDAEAAGTDDFSVCTATKYHSILESTTPDLAHRAVAMPFRKDRDFNFDLTSDFEAKATEKVLTFLMVRP